MDSDDKKPVFSKELLLSLRNISGVMPSPTQTPKSNMKERHCISVDDSDDSQSLVFYPKAILKGIPYSENKEQKTGDNLLDVPRQKKKPICEFFSPSSMSSHSNWDNFFESQTELTESRNISRKSSDESQEWGVYESAPSSPMSPHGNQRTFFPSPKKDKVFVSCRTKTGMRWSCKNLSTRMGEVVEWLNEGAMPKCWLPISGNTVGKNNKSGDDLAKKTIAEVMCDLNPLNQGLACFSGSVNGKLSIKISVCDLDKIIAATTTCNSKQLKDEKS